MPYATWEEDAIDVPVFNMPLPLNSKRCPFTIVSCSLRLEEFEMVPRVSIHDQFLSLSVH